MMYEIITTNKSIYIFNLHEELLFYLQTSAGKTTIIHGLNDIYTC